MHRRPLDLTRRARASVEQRPAGEIQFPVDGTSIAAGTSSSNATNAARNKISAEQKLFDGLNITTSVTDVGAPTASKSITAGYKWKW
jgi:hypothetical protein